MEKSFCNCDRYQWPTNEMMNMRRTSKEVMMFDVQAFAKKREKKTFLVDVDKFKSEVADAVRELEMKIDMITGQHAAAVNVQAKYER